VIPYSAAFDIGSFFIFLIFISGTLECGFLFVLFNNFKSHKMEFQEQSIFVLCYDAVLFHSSLLCYFCEFIYK